jgi:hypothetical protein
MTMTAGERAIWAAAYVDEIREAREAAASNARAGLQPLRLDPYVRAVIQAGRAVQAARRALPKLIEQPVDEKWREERDSEIAMLRDMLGIDTNGTPYR